MAFARGILAAVAQDDAQPLAPGIALDRLDEGDEVDLVGPLGRAFPLPTEPVACVLVGGGYGSAPLGWLAEQLRARGCHVEMVLGAASEDRLFGVARARAVADGVTVTTDDGSAGIPGWVSHALPGVVRLSRAAVVYACGPMAMLRAVADAATRAAYSGVRRFASARMPASISSGCFVAPQAR